MLDHPLAEFDRQAELIIRRGSCGLLTDGAESVEPELQALRHEVDRRIQLAEPRTGNIPLVIVKRQNPFPYADFVGTLVGRGRAGYIEMTPKVPEDFTDIDGLNLPASAVYVLWDVDTGQNMLNISPADCLNLIAVEGRTPLTMQEGLFAVSAVPELLTDKKKFNCIQMPGSRIADDQRVPSIWMSKGAPRLGWCWFGNIHTWLATASARMRIAAG